VAVNQPHLPLFFSNELANRENSLLGTAVSVMLKLTDLASLVLSCAHRNWFGGFDNIEDAPPEKGADAGLKYHAIVCELYSVHF
jgi:hypothetical protein